MQSQQLELAHMPRRLFACTPSRLAAFDCPRRYRMTYLDRPTPTRGAPWAHNTVGAVVHLALAQWWRLPKPRRVPAAGAELVARNWQDNGFRDEAQAARWRSVAAGWVADYLLRHGGPADMGSAALGSAALGSAERAPVALGQAEPVGIERTVAVTTAGLAVSGRVDRIDDRGAELVVVDYKAGRRTLSTDDARGSLALALYALAVRRTLRRPCRRVELHHVPTGTVVAFEHTEESLARHVARAEATAHDVVAATDTLAAGADLDQVFPPSVSPVCSWCDFRAHCPEGQRAAAPRQPWDGLPEEDRPPGGRA